MERAGAYSFGTVRSQIRSAREMAPSGGLPKRREALPRGAESINAVKMPAKRSALAFFPGYEVERSLVGSKVEEPWS